MDPDGVVNIRDLGPVDAAAFQTLRLQGLQECPDAFASSYDEEADTSLEVVAERLAARPDRCVLGAVRGSELVGVIGLRREEMTKLAHKALIWGMYVAPAARRKHVGHLLVTAALKRAATMPGVRQIYLGVNARNVAAIGLYEALGFTAFGLERGFMLLDGELHDEIHMVFRLPAAVAEPAEAAMKAASSRGMSPRSAVQGLHLRQVDALDHTAWLRMRSALWPGDEREHAAEIDAFLSGKALDLDAVFVCGDGDRGLVGFIELRIRNYAEDSDSVRVPYVEGWYVDPTCRKQGIGAMLMAQAEAWARELGHSELASDCELDNTVSIAAHGALGFAETTRLVCFLKHLS